MNKLLSPFILISAIIFITACNNSDEEHNHGMSEPTTTVDSLLKDVIDGHDEAMMAQMTKMKKAKEGVGNLIDSISKLPGKASEAATALKEKLNGTLDDLNEADSAMNKWMNEFSYDSLKNNTEERIKYLKNEKLKIGEVKEAIMSSLAKADSVLKK